MTDNELAIRAAINVLRDTIESGRMPSGLRLAPDAAALHERAATHLQTMLRRECRNVPPDDYLLWSRRNGWWPHDGPAFGYRSHLPEAGRYTRVAALTMATHTQASFGTSSRLNAFPVLPVRLADIEMMVAAFRKEYPGEPVPWE